MTVKKINKEQIRQRLKLPSSCLKELNDFLLDPHNPLINALLDLIEQYGGPESINRKAEEARKLENLLAKLKNSGSPYYKDLLWLIRQRDEKAFIPIADYYKKLLGKGVKKVKLNQKHAVTLEISSLQFFPFLIAEALQAIANKELMPARYIRVRNMKEQVQDNDDILAVAAAMQVIGASYVETLDTKGTDGSNIHLGGPATITGYFGGVGQPNHYPLKWAEEFLHYYTNYGIRQVLNVNAGTIMLAYLLYRLGVNIEFKISVFMGIDNPFSILWTLIGANLFARSDKSTPLVGFNLANSVNNDTIYQAAKIRQALGLEDKVRFEHHITEAYKSIVLQPYDRLGELLEVAAKVKNISAKHEGAFPDIEETLEHPSDILDYFIPKAELLAKNLMPALERNYLNKHGAVNRTAEALIRSGIGVICAGNLHR
jgi:hypothetical protein